MQKMLLGYLLTNEEVYLNCIPAVRQAGILDNIDLRMVEWAVQYRDKSKRLPTWEELQVVYSFVPTKVLLEPAFVIAEIAKNVCETRLRNWIINVAGDIEKGTVSYARVQEELHRLVKEVGIGVKEGIDIKDLYVDILDAVFDQERNEFVTSGLPTLDKALGGGFQKGEAAVLIAPPGVGKTMWLLNCCYASLVARKNVLFLSCEMSEVRLLERLYRRIAGVSREDIRRNKDKVKVTLDKFFKMVNAKGIILHKKSEEWGVEDIKFYLERLRAEGTAIDVVIVDYLDKLRMKKGDRRLALRDLAEEFRYMTLETNTCGISACLTGDTKIETLEGQIPIKDLVGKKDVSVWSYDLESKQITIGKVLACFLSNPQVPVYEVTLDNGKQVKATFNHPFLLRNGTYRKVEDLMVGDSLMPFYRIQDYRGYNHICLNNGKRRPEHQIVAEYVYNRKIKPDEVTHHKDYNPRNNLPSNLVILDRGAHQLWHKRFTGLLNPAKNPVNRERWSKRMLASNPMHNSKYVERMRKTKLKGFASGRVVVWNKDLTMKTDERVKRNAQGFIRLGIEKKGKTYEQIYGEVQAKQIRLKKMVPSVVKYCGVCGKRFIVQLYRKCAKYCSRKCYNLRDKKPTVKVVCVQCGKRFLSCYKNRRYCSRQCYKQRDCLTKFSNHKVVSVKFIGNAPVYNLTVDKYHNFAIEAGVIVKNTQANKLSLLAIVVTEEHVSESFGKVEVLDVVMSLSRTAKEEEKGQGRIVVLKNRDRSGKGAVVPVQIDFDKCSFTGY